VNTFLRPEPPTGPPLREAWRIQADGLLTQRLYLHLDEWRAVVDAGAPSADEPSASTSRSTSRSTAPVPTEAARLLDRAGLAHWWRLPRRHGYPTTATYDLLYTSSAQAARALLDDPGDLPWHQAVTEAARAGAWWVGFLAAIRHRGKHHRRPAAKLPPIPERTPADAARTVVYGVSARVLRAQLRVGDDPKVRRAYCRAVVAGIDAERTLPALLDRLAETRLVDLVGTSLAWHGQFAAYAQGSASGRRE
jgi:hypothetical protein